MASKSGSESTSTEQIEELLDTVDSTLDRLKTLYEQYFLGIQKQAPSYIHSDVERKLRELTQLNIRNTGLRYRLATLQQKFGSYNSYWRRTLRQIENGTYARNLAKISRDAARNGTEIPEEILAAMPKRMREQVLRDRDQAVATAKRRKQLEDDAQLALADDGPPKQTRTATGAHVIEDEEIDFKALFSAFEDDAPKLEAAVTQPIRRPATRPPMPRMPVPEAVRRTGTTRPPVPATAPPPTPPTPPPRPTHETAPTQAIRRPVAHATGPAQTASPPRAPAQPTARQTGPVPVPVDPRVTGPMPAIEQPPSGSTQAIPRAPTTQPIPRPPLTQPIARVAPSQQSRPVPVIPGAAAKTGPVPVESMAGPFPRTQQPPSPSGRTTQAIPRPPLRPPPGMTDADVNALHAKYVKAKEMVGEKVDPGSREKLLKTINQSAPKIMAQYKASGVDFSVVVKDNQVVLKAKPKT